MPVALFVCCSKNFFSVNLLSSVRDILQIGLTSQDMFVYFRLCIIILLFIQLHIYVIVGVE